MNILSFINRESILESVHARQDVKSDGAELNHATSEWYVRDLSE